MKKDLSSLTVRMPNQRFPMPSVMAPSLLNLTYLHITDIDPACYPDNISELLYTARKLEHLKLHFSPRMRREREPSISLEAFFGRVKTSDYRMALKSLAIQNLYAGNHGNYTDMYKPECIEEITLIDSSGGADNDASMSFVSHMPIKLPNLANVRMLRGNKASAMHAKAVQGMLKTMRYYYLITGRPLKDIPLSPQVIGPQGSISQVGSPENFDTPSMGSTPKSTSQAADATATSGRRSSSMAASDKSVRGEAAVANLCSSYIDTICLEQRQHMRNLLLFPQWKLSSDHLTRLVRYCPNLEELGLSVEPPTMDVINYLAPHLPKLTTLRILSAPDFADMGDNLPAVTEWYELRVGAAAWNKKNATLRWVGVGDLTFEVLKGQDREVDVDGVKQMARSVRRVPLSRVRQLDVWARDVLEI